MDEQGSRCQDQEQQAAGVEIRKLPLETTASARQEIMIYQREFGLVKLDVKFEVDYICLHQNKLAEFYDTTKLIVC